MRTVNIASDIIAYIPEMRVYAFSPSYVKVTAPALTEITLAFNSLSQKRITNGQGEVYFHMMPIFKTYFNDIEFADLGTFTSYLNSASKTISKQASITISGHSTAQDETVTITQYFDIVWGAEQITRAYKQLETAYVFDGYPFTITHNIGSSSSIAEILGTNYSSFGKDIDLGQIVADEHAEPTVSILSGAGGSVLKTFITKRMQPCQNTLYLRWIDLEGEYKYYLLNTSSIDENSQNGETINKYPYHIGAENGSIKGRIKMFNKVSSVVINCGVQTADDDLTELMRGLQESILQWAYIGGNWVEISIDAMSISKKRLEGNRQIDVKVILPQIYTQSL